MSRTTRAHTIREHLRKGGLTDLRLDVAKQRAPDEQETDGFSVRQHKDETGALVVVAGAYGPNWLRTQAEICGLLERPFVRCVVLAEAPGVADHEVLVRWGTAEELRARAHAQAARQAELVAQLRKQEAEQRAEAERQAREDAGQYGLF
ncbi:hypothetical protein HHL19_35855 [Streptomyces sp. R302]|uniref:hypothetical protein n=1 Tax=unclassified Streptomyces TaxID=2593676 RepID=UPI00145CB785|nr:MULTISPECIES: hypothetical protein [unclassified Streptomyces]NML55084.1 hypothetical protein [Streptomyces sp. R301]NML83886.1 hypothetical protein [Streptomyces sp. R302]